MPRHLVLWLLVPTLCGQFGFSGWLVTSFHLSGNQASTNMDPSQYKENHLRMFWEPFRRVSLPTWLLNLVPSLLQLGDTI